MRDLPTGLAAAFASSVTTHCHCWTLTRADGTVFGFTDHDRDLEIDGITFEAASGLRASESEREAGLASQGGEISGSLSSARITPEDIAAGRYDGAEIRRYLVDWQAPLLDFTLDVMWIGDIRQKDGAFIAETRDAFAKLDAVEGRRYQAQCDAALGDARCGFDLGSTGFSLSTTIASRQGEVTLAIAGADAFEPGWFTRGVLRVEGGAFDGLVRAIKEHRVDGVITLWEPLPDVVATGAGVTLSAGCDKRFSTCRDRFANAVNFRGFPLIPAPEFAFSYARAGEGTHQGRPLVRP